MSVDVNIVALVKIILLQCVVGQLDQELYVMHVALCGQIRFVQFDFMYPSTFLGSSFCPLSLLIFYF